MFTIAKIFSFIYHYVYKCKIVYYLNRKNKARKYVYYEMQKTWWPCFLTTFCFASVDAKHKVNFT